ncbi:hypothetical protein PBCV1_a650aL [Paramecium bursaria Chlorella virus 1]|uniref:Uncharacterized protein n=1 Tax=Paramecium bursaria Chlorella virus 1 TaxID=10506 RepID=F8TU80_PBCV1|nr:hypothetical protein PBCV1_a650aL [Paramecium bursaria Chlorella virus 1]AEI70141.1 hypothetical protein [Paramecium bursaria Chlorella virus 1]
MNHEDLLPAFRISFFTASTARFTNPLVSTGYLYITLVPAA